MSWLKNHMIEIEDRGFGDIGKYICADCVEDAFLKNWIKENAEYTDECSYCGECHDIVCMETLMEEVIMKGIRHYYSNAEGNLYWDNEDDEFFGTTYDIHDIMYDFECDISSNPEVIEDIKEAIGCDITWCRRNPYSSTEREICEYSWKHFSDLVKYENRYFFLNEDSDEDMEIYSPLDILDAIADKADGLGLIKALPVNTDFYRVRIFKDKKDLILDDANLGSPPKESANIDRMSACGISVFYASDKIETSILEACNKDCRADKDIIAVGHFRNVHELKYLDLTAISTLGFPSIFDLDKYKESEDTLFFKNLNTSLTKPIEELTAIEYVPTQIFAEYFRKVKNLDGIKYNSSKDKNGICYVLFFNNKQCISDAKKTFLGKRNKCELKLINARVYSGNGN